MLINGCDWLTDWLIKWLMGMWRVLPELNWKMRREGNNYFLYDSMIQFYILWCVPRISKCSWKNDSFVSTALSQHWHRTLEQILKLFIRLNVKYLLVYQKLAFGSLGPCFNLFFASYANRPFKMGTSKLIFPWISWKLITQMQFEKSVSTFCHQDEHTHTHSE